MNSTINKTFYACFEEPLLLRYKKISKKADFIKRVASLAKIQSAGEASQHLTLIDNCQTC